MGAYAVTKTAVLCTGCPAVLLLNLRDTEDDNDLLLQFSTNRYIMILVVCLIGRPDHCYRGESMKKKQKASLVFTILSDIIFILLVGFVLFGVLILLMNFI